MSTEALLSEYVSKTGASLPQLYTHKSVQTAEEHALELSDKPGIPVKNLVLKDKKGTVFLVCIPADMQVNLKDLLKVVEGKGGLRFADGELLKNVLGTEQGSVTPLDVRNDKEHAVQVVVSHVLAEAEFVLVHTVVNSESVALRPADLCKFIAACGNQVAVKDVGGNSNASDAGSGEKGKKAEEKNKQVVAAAADDEFKDEIRSREDLIGIEASKTKDFSRWYSQVVFRSEMIDYYDVSGCYILRPWSYFIWEQIQNYFDAEIKKLGVKNTYFPLFVSKSALMREKDHIEGFAPEVAWVTKAGSSDLQEHIAIRPTSETIMYSAFAKWIRSHRDLPLQINQWSNVVRWEFKNPTPFIRTREFLWQEGHSAFSSREEAEVEVHQILDIYARVYEDLLAIPVTKGKKTEKEKFAGALFTTTIEVFVPAAGRGIQAATSHCLGQNFAHMFDIKFEDKKGEAKHVWQNSWGLSTRSIGALVMVHGDDKGLVLPPKVAQIQVIIVPIHFKDSKDIESAINDKCEELCVQLKNAGIRAESDLRSIYNPGWKFNHWELKGVPIRIEIGPKDFNASRVTLVRRDTLEKKQISWTDVVRSSVLELDAMHKSLFEKARSAATPLIFECETWEAFLDALSKGGRGLCPSCDETSCEMEVRERSGAESSATAAGLSGAAKSLCIPFTQPNKKPLNCFQCGKPAKCWTLFGRSY
jgi:prolyl-tRNA synthetase